MGTNLTYTADLHLHSYFARGTSPELTFENLAVVGEDQGD